MLYFLIIIIICLLYVHIKYYIDYVNNEEIYEMNTISKSVLDELTYFKNPILFNYNIDMSYNLEKINILDISNNYNEILLKSEQGNNLIKLSNYYSQYNSINNIINDSIFKPITTISSEYDILFGSKDVTTKLSSNYSNRTILIVIEGVIDIKLLHPKYSNVIDNKLNYKHIVSESNYNIWKDNVHNHLTINLEKGRAISIPIYWWWSVKFGKSAKILQFKYYTFMNQIVLLPILSKIWLNN